MKQSSGELITVKDKSVAVQFWPQDGVWNGIAVDMAVAVFGETLAEARERLRVAVTKHLDIANEMGLQEDVRWTP